MKTNCGICNEKRNLFTVNKESKEIKACSDCITEQLLTGWSK
jgi:hypothetical protein